MSSLLIVTEWPLRVGWESDFLTRTLLRQGISEKEISYCSLLTERPYAGQFSRATDSARLAGAERLSQAISSTEPSVILALGEWSLRAICPELSGIEKWQSSVLHRSVGVVIPCFGTDRIAQDLSLQVWLSLSARKVASALKEKPKEPKYDFLLNPPLPEALNFLRRIRNGSTLSVDIETGRGQINTVGFAISPTEAIAINVLPDRMGDASHYELWGAIRDLLESDQPKILQNFIYETLFFSRYGIRLRGVLHDTMIAQKFLWPEFEMGLDAVGRMYTDMPYWKDDGKSWNNIRDWERHYEYNCKDTVGTFRGYQGQLADLESRGLSKLYYGYLVKLFPAVAEMCSWGFPVSPETLKELKGKVSSEIEELTKSLAGESDTALNPRSPTQVKGFLRAKGYAIPKKYNSQKKQYQESTDEKSLKKLRLKYPEDKSLDLLLRFAKLNKAYSSYLSFTYDADNRMRYSLNCHGTETGRWSGYGDPWDNGFNPQTTPGGNKGINIKNMFHAEQSFVLMQIDLKQAESRFVAYDSADANLIATLEDASRDIHKEVAAEIYKKPVSEVTKGERQLGKKSGHGANYSMKEATFQDSCISEMDLVLSRTEANRALEAYHTLYPSIRRWHSNIRKELAQTRCLRTPLGRERYFYGRLDEDTFRQAYAYKPQSTIPDIVNHLMLFLMEAREAGKLDFRLLLQCHDSLLLEVSEGPMVSLIAESARNLDNWHPTVVLSGGRLRIPVSIETGVNWGDLHEYRE